jgi:hypothetical protein
MCRLCTFTCPNSVSYHLAVLCLKSCVQAILGWWRYYWYSFIKFSWPLCNSKTLVVLADPPTPNTLNKTHNKMVWTDITTIKCKLLSISKLHTPQTPNQWENDKSNKKSVIGQTRGIYRAVVSGKMIMSAVIKPYESQMSLTKCQTITNSSDELPWLPSDFIHSWQWI